MQYTKGQQEQNNFASLQKQIQEFNAEEGYLKISYSDGQSVRECLELFRHCHNLIDMNDVDEIAEILFDALQNHFFLLDANGCFEKFTEKDKEDYFKELDYTKSSNKLFTISQTILFLMRMQNSVERIDFFSRNNEKESAA